MERNEIQHSQLGMYSLSYLEKEPHHLRTEIARCNRELHDTAVSGIKVFLESADSIQQTQESISTFLSNADMLNTVTFPQFHEASKTFLKEAQTLRAEQQKAILLLQHQTELYDFLELPTVMERCISCGLFEEGLALLARGRALLKYYPDISVLRLVVRDLELTSHYAARELLSLLESNIELPFCLKIIGFLRRYLKFSQEELCIQFLLRRERWFESQLKKNTLPSYLFIDINRAQIFEIVTHFRAIFFTCDDTTDEAYSSSSFIFWGYTLLHRWIFSRISLLLSSLSEYLPSITDSSILVTLLEHSFHCGVSLARIGLDFKPLFIPLFQKHIIRLYKSVLVEANQTFSVNLSRFRWYYNEEELQEIGTNLSFLKESTTITSDQRYQSHHPIEINSLLHFPPLAFLLNDWIASINVLRECALMSLRFEIKELFQEIFIELLQIISDHHISSNQTHQQQEKCSSIFYEPLARIMLSFYCSSLSRVFAMDSEFLCCKDLLTLFPSKEIEQFYSVKTQDQNIDIFEFSSKEDIDQDDSDKIESTFIFSEQQNQQSEEDDEVL